MIGRNELRKSPLPRQEQKGVGCMDDLDNKFSFSLELLVALFSAMVATAGRAWSFRRTVASWAAEMMQSVSQQIRRAGWDIYYILLGREVRHLRC